MQSNHSFQKYYFTDRREAKASSDVCSSLPVSLYPCGMQLTLRWHADVGNFPISLLGCSSSSGRWNSPEYLSISPFKAITILEWGKVLKSYNIERGIYV